MGTRGENAESRSLHRVMQQVGAYVSERNHRSYRAASCFNLAVLRPVCVPHLKGLLGPRLPRLRLAAMRQTSAQFLSGVLRNSIRSEPSEPPESKSLAEAAQAICFNAARRLPQRICLTCETGG